MVFFFVEKHGDGNYFESFCAWTGPCLLAHTVEYVMYMGKDKMENEHLIKYGWPEDLWWVARNPASCHDLMRAGSTSTTFRLHTCICGFRLASQSRLFPLK
jgi:hypothetical protein